MWGANRFNATSYIRAKHRGPNLSLGFDQVKGLRNRSFLGKERAVAEDPQSSARRKPMHLHGQ